MLDQWIRQKRKQITEPKNNRRETDQNSNLEVGVQSEFAIACPNSCRIGKEIAIFLSGGVRSQTYAFSAPLKKVLKGLSHEIDFQNFDKNLQNLV
jgi:hypothetical protein